MSYIMKLMNNNLMMSHGWPYTYSIFTKDISRRKDRAKLKDVAKPSRNLGSVYQVRLDARTLGHQHNKVRYRL